MAVAGIEVDTSVLPVHGWKNVIAITASAGATSVAAQTERNRR